MHWSGKAAEFRAGDNPRLGESVVVYGFPMAGALSSERNVTTGNITALAGAYLGLVAYGKGRMKSIGTRLPPGPCT